MESGTLELLRCLQSGPFDESNWKHIRTTLRGQRRYLRAQHDLSTLADLVQLLESWAQSCDNPRLGADALREAADIAERELSQPDHATDLRKRALAHSHSGGERTRPNGNTANPHTAQGHRRVEAGDLNGAIDSYERALNVEADMDVVYRLAELYSQRSGPGDAEQSADLFCTLGDVLGNPAGIPMLQRALEQVPDHAEALNLFTQYGGSTAMAPPAATSARPRSANARGGVMNQRESAPSAPTHRIASHRTVAGLGAPGPVVPSPASTASAPHLAPSTANRPILKSSTSAAPRGRMQRARSQPLVVPEPRGALASDAAAQLDAPQLQPTTGERERIAEDPTPRNHPTNDNAFDTEPGETEDFDQRAAEEYEQSKGPPPLKSAKDRARELQPTIPQTAPVITIKQQHSGTSFGPTGPVSSLSPVVVDEERALTRARERLIASRARRRKIVATVVATAAIAAAGVVVFVPKSLKDAQHYAENFVTREARETSSNPTTGTTSQLTNEPTPPPLPEPEMAKPAEVPSPEPAAAPSDETKTPEPQPKVAETKKEPEAPAGSVLAQLEQANLRGGKLTDAQLTTAFEKAGPKLDKCYVDALDKKPRLKGKLLVAFTVKPNGKVASAKKQGGTIKDAGLIRCTLDAILDTKFPKPKKQAAQVRMPLEYKKS